jgi:hypothetical protein
MLALLAAITEPVTVYVPSRIPEPTDFALFGLAIAGLIIGRQTSRRRPEDKDGNA